MAKAALTAENEALKRNLLGQRLGRKGRGTRERILAATQTLLAGPPDAPISLSAVAREASLGMTTLYLYFADLPELLLAVLEPISASAEEAYFAQLREPWPDERLGECCATFVEAYYNFWMRHSRILHLRNTYAENHEERMRNHRNLAARRIIMLFVQQMEAESEPRFSRAWGLATALISGIEHMLFVATDVNFPSMLEEKDNPGPHVRNLLWAEARLLELGVRDGRTASRAAKTQG